MLLCPRADVSPEGGRDLLAKSYSEHIWHLQNDCFKAADPAILYTAAAQGQNIGAINLPAVPYLMLSQVKTSHSTVRLHHPRSECGNRGLGLLISCGRWNAGCPIRGNNTSGPGKCDRVNAEFDFRSLRHNSSQHLLGSLS